MDIAIEIVGRRPGEKLHEELFNPDERPQPTPAEKIVAAVRRRSIPSGWRGRSRSVEELVYHGEPAALAKTVASLARERGLLRLSRPARGSSRSCCDRRAPNDSPV